MDDSESCRSIFACRPDMLLSSSLGLLSCWDEDDFEVIIGEADVNIDSITKSFMVCLFFRCSKYVLLFKIRTACCRNLHLFKAFNAFHMGHFGALKCSSLYLLLSQSLSHNKNPQICWLVLLAKYLTAFNL